MKLTEYKTNLYHYFEDENELWQGARKRYYNNGSLYVHCYYKDNNRHGEYKEYYSNGQIYIHCFFKDNKLHSEYKHYNADGSLYYIKYYSNGKDVTDMYNKLQAWKKL